MEDSRDDTNQTRPKQENTKRIIGIDLGTTNSCVAHMVYNPKTKAFDPCLIPIGNERILKSVVYYDNNQILVGDVAVRKGITAPKKCIYVAKRFIGKKMHEVTDSQRKGLSYDLIANENNEPVFKIPNDDGTHQIKTPVETQSHILRSLKSSAEKYLGDKVHAAVITVPAYFNDSQRQATKDAGAIAGLEVLKIVNEPTAAALAYHGNKKIDCTIMIFDMGGGTFDVSILQSVTEIVDGKEEFLLKVIGTGGDNNLGGEDYDYKVMEYIYKRIYSRYGIDFSKDDEASNLKMQESQGNSISFTIAHARFRIKSAAETAKKDLTDNLNTSINLPFLCLHEGQIITYSDEISRAEFDRLVEELNQKAMKACAKTVNETFPNGDGLSEIKEVILVGGMTRVNCIRKEVEDYFKKQPKSDINPDEAVAMGAALQTNILTGQSDLTLLDVIALPMGIVTKGNVLTTVIPKNTTIPTEKELTFTTAEDMQPSVEIHIYQGERSRATDNHALGQFTLENIEKAPAGVPKILVKFSVNTDGILEVTAKDAKTQSANKIAIDRPGLSKEEIEKMRKEAAMYEAEDAKFIANTELKNQLEVKIHQIEKTATQSKNEEVGRMMPDIQDLNRRIKDHIKQYIAMTNINYDEEKAKLVEMEKEVNALGEKLQSILQNQDGTQQNAASQTDGPASGG